MGKNREMAGRSRGNSGLFHIFHRLFHNRAGEKLHTNGMHFGLHK